MKRSDYFKKQIEDANELFMNANAGWDDADGWEEANGEEEENNYEDEDQYNAFGDIDMGFSGQPALNARGGMGRPVPVSQPYIITAQNTTTDAVTNVEILDALKRQLSFATSGISYGTGYSNVTYNELLSAIASGNPTFLCGQLRLSASSSTTADAEANVLETITILVKDINGRQNQMSIPPELDSYQQIKTQSDIYIPFFVNGFTSLKIAQIRGSLTMTFKLYPASKSGQLGTLTQKGPQKLANPKTNKALSK